MGLSLAFDVAPLLEDDSLKQFYDSGSRNYLYLLIRYLKRCVLLLRSYRYDLIWIEKEIFPLLPATFERALGILGVKTIVDYDDATYVSYKQHRYWLVRKFLGSKIEAVCRSAHAVVAGNPTLAAFARNARAANVIIVPSVVNLDPQFKPSPHRPPLDPNRFVVGWIGTPSNIQHLKLFEGAVTGMASEPGFTFLTIGAKKHLFEGVQQEAHPWSEESEARPTRQMRLHYRSVGRWCF